MYSIIIFLKMYLVYPNLSRHESEVKVYLGFKMYYRIMSIVNLWLKVN
jgi:hypothetical protein